MFLLEQQFTIHGHNKGWERGMFPVIKLRAVLDLQFSVEFLMSSILSSEFKHSSLC